MKRSLIAVAVLLAGVFLFSACSKSVMSHEMTLWLENARLSAEETPGDLYEKALAEDVLTVYSVSSRMLEVAEAFEAEYPGLLVEVQDLRGERLIADARATIDSGRYDCDILFLTDVNGVLSNDFIPNGYAHPYIPSDMADKMIKTQDNLVPLFTEAIFIHYNPALFEEQPIENWWELTEERWHGKVYAPNPMQSVTTLAMYNMFIKNNDLMEEAYEEWAEEPFAGENGESAAETFIRKLVENGLHIVNSSDEVADAVGLNDEDEALGLMVSSKLRLRQIGYHLEFATGVSPFDGVASSVNIMIAGGARNINTAKLFIRFIFGETDGTGTGYLPYLQEGAWSMRLDVQSEEERPLSDLTLIYSDEGYTYENQEDFHEFWEELLA